ncbi:Ger(x)C family spore germination protein [Cytobacillus firmus]|uniref:Ger(x)C family spore germination protein n=1 Tax=Cytobacillus firmus TaxID=1399 RepID=UPI00384B9360
MRKYVHLWKYVCLLVMIFLLSGCWDQISIDKRAYVVAVGLDKGEKEDEIKITYLISNPELSKQQGGSDEPPREIISFQTSDIITSKNLANTTIAKDIVYDLLSVMIVSEDFAKSGDFIRWMYDATKDREIKRNIPLIVTKEEASKFINENDPKLETRIHKYFNLILDHGIQTGFIPDSDLHRFFRIAEADADLFLGIYGSAEEEKEGKQKEQFFAGGLQTEGETNRTQFVGAAVFKEGRMIGRLTGEETRLSGLLNNTISKSDILTSFPDPFDERYRIAARIIQKEANVVKMNLKNGEPAIDVTVPLYMEILSDHSMVNYAKHSGKRNHLKQYIEERITQKMNDLIAKTQEEYKGEPFGWSLIARRHFSTVPEYEKFDWMKSYPNMKVNVAVKIKFGEFGRQSELPSLEQMRD